MRRLVLAAPLVTLLAAAPAAAQGWQYDAILYGWFAGIDGTLGVGRAGDIPVDASVSDLMNYLDFTAAGHFEARNPKMVLLTDVYYVGLSNGRDVEIANQTVRIDMDLNEWILELGGGLRVSEEFDVLLVGRYYIQDLGATAPQISSQTLAETSVDWGDLFLGARYSTPLGSKWLVSLRGDIGTGGSDLALFGNAAILYRFSDLFSTGLAYRVLSVDYETGSGATYYKYDTTTGGLGLALRFMS
jgi:hypothetical protein